MIRINLKPQRERTRTRDSRLKTVAVLGVGALVLGMAIGSVSYFRSRAPAAEPIQPEPVQLIDLGEATVLDSNKPRCEGEAKAAVDIYADGIARASKHKVNRALDRIKRNENGPGGKQFAQNLRVCLQEHEQIGPIVSAYAHARGMPSENLNQIADATLEVRTNPDAKRRYGKKFYEAVTSLRKPENKQENGLTWFHALLVGIIGLGYVVLRAITNIKPEAKPEKAKAETEEHAARREDSESELDRLLHEIFDGLTPEQRTELLDTQYVLSYQRELQEYLSLPRIIEDGTAEVTLRRARYFVELPEDTKAEIRELTEQLADRLLAWTEDRSIDRTFGYARDKYISAMFWDIMKYCAHVDGAVRIKNERKPAYSSISDLQDATFIRGIDLSAPERLTEAQLQTIVDNCYFDASPIGHGIDAKLRQELAIQRMKQWFMHEQPR